MARHIIRVVLAQRLGGCLLFVVLVLFNSSPMTKHWPAFNQLVVFGDSLSDIGNAL
jgi:hypothetical protein